MLKTTIFFLFGCSLYFGQSIKATGISSNQNNSPANRETVEGVKAQNSGGGEGAGPFAIIINQTTKKEDLNIYLMPSDTQFSKYTIYDLSGNVKKTQQISPTNSCSIDLSNLIPGNYLIKVEAVSSAIVTKLFVKM